MYINSLKMGFSMKKLLFSLMACGSFMCASDDNERVLESEAAYINSAGAILSATQVANTCLVMPVVSQLVIKQLVNVLGKDNGLLALIGGVSVGFLTSVGTEQLINLSVLKSSKRYGTAILNAGRAVTDKYIPTGLVGFLAFLASLV